MTKCPAREKYLQFIESPDYDAGDKEQQNIAKALRTAYLHTMHDYVSEVYPHLLFEKTNDKVFWNYDELNGIYEELSFSEVRGMVIGLLLADDLSASATESFVKNVINRYRAAYVELGVGYDDFDTDDNYFHAKNGWVNLQTLEFESHTPDRLSRIKSTVQYDKNATCPRYNQFLDIDLQLKKDQVRVIDQFSGLSLTNSIEHQKMLTLLGRPGCGKSTLLDSWSYVIGDMMMEKKLTELQGDSMRFAGTQFVGKRLCWFDEVDVKKAEMGNSLGTLITGQHINVERKGINGIVKAQNTLKCVLTANRLPLAAELGIYRRLIMIPIQVSFVDSGTQEIEIHKTLKAEASGILNRMIRGLHDLQKMGTFTVIEGHEDLVEEYKAASDTIAEFLDEYFEPGTEEEVVPSRVLHRSYQHFAEGNSFMRTITPQKFGQLLASQPLIRFSHIRSIRTMNERQWSGLKLKEGYVIDDHTNLIESIKSASF